MIYDDFVQKAMHYDKRNIFIKSMISEFTQEIPRIYKYYDPLDVEVAYKNSALTFVSYVDLGKMLQRYSYLNADCVFAISNGDPFFLRKGSVYTCAHGDRNAVPEKLADSFDDFLEQIL